MDHNLTERMANFAHTIQCVYYSALAEVCSLWSFFFNRKEIKHISAQANSIALHKQELSGLNNITCRFLIWLTNIQQLDWQTHM